MTVPIKTMLGALVVGIVGILGLSPAIADPDGEKLLNNLIAQARQEGAFNGFLGSAMTGRTSSKLEAAFKKRFGLDIDVSLPLINPTRYASKAAAEAKAGVQPKYDVYGGSGKNAVQLVALGAVQKIDNWKSLLAEINSDVRAGRARPEQISHEPFTGFAFLYLSRLKTLIYNTQLISREKLPTTHPELGDPKYKGMWSQPPFAAHWDIGLLAYPNVSKEDWLEIVRKAGKTAGAVQGSNASTQRVLLGEYAFMVGNTYNFLRVKAKDPEAPIDITYFKDYNPVVGSYYVVRKGAKHPAAATLFTLWMGTPEAKAIWQAETYYTQFLWGETELDRKIRKYLEESAGKVTSFFDTQNGVELLRWYGTKEGRQYRKAISRAIRGEKAN